MCVETNKSPQKLRTDRNTAQLGAAQNSSAQHHKFRTSAMCACHSWPKAPSVCWVMVCVAFWDLMSLTGAIIWPNPSLRIYVSMHISISSPLRPPTHNTPPTHTHTLSLRSPTQVRHSKLNIMALTSYIIALLALPSLIREYWQHQINFTQKPPYANSSRGKEPSLCYSFRLWFQGRLGTRQGT